MVYSSALEKRHASGHREFESHFLRKRFRLYLIYMEKPDIQLDLQERYDEIKREINKLRKEAQSIPAEQLRADIEKINILSEKFDGRTAEEDQEYKSLENKINEVGLLVQTLPEFRYALECLNIFSPHQITDIISHENAHANKAESLGVGFRGYKIIIFKRADGKGSVKIMAGFDEMPVDWSREKKREVNKQISYAPEEYESKDPLSSGDNATINRMANN